MAEPGLGSKTPLWLAPVPLCAFLTPVIAAPSGRGLVPVLIIFGGWALLNAWRADALRAVFSRPLTLWVVASATLAAVSTAWSDNPHQSIKVAAGFAGLAIVGLSLLRSAETASEKERDTAGRALFAGVVVALVLLTMGYGYGATTRTPLWGETGQHPLAVLSHAQTVIAVLCVPAVWVAWSLAGAARLLACVATIAVVALYALLEHTASNLAIVGALAAFVAVRAGGCRLAAILLVGLAIVVILAPWVGDAVIMQRTELDTLTSEEDMWSSKTHRMFMWRFVIDHIHEGPFWLGYGADASRNFPGAGEKVLWGLEIMPLHPHNGALQVRLELGIVGAALATVPFLIAARSVWGLDAKSAAVGLAVIAAFLMPWMLSYGIWQSWWLAFAWLAAVIGRSLMPG